MRTRRFAFLLLAFAWLVSSRAGPGTASASSAPSHWAPTFARMHQSSAHSTPVLAAAGDDSKSVLTRTQALVQCVQAASYPELAGIDIRVRTFQSKADYFRTRISVGRYLSLRRMRFYVEVNSRLFDQAAPEDGVRAIIAHELEHVLYFSKRSRLEMLSVAGLTSRSFTTRFERRADLRAIGRGYGAGLILYRQWLYNHIPANSLAEKRRDYFSPEEIRAIQSIIQQRPEARSYWLGHVPLSIEDIQKQREGSNR